MLIHIKLTKYKTPPSKLKRSLFLSNAPVMIHAVIIEASIVPATEVGPNIFSLPPNDEIIVAITTPTVIVTSQPINNPMTIVFVIDGLFLLWILFLYISPLPFHFMIMN
jgi:hypothetical protein